MLKEACIVVDVSDLLTLIDPQRDCPSAVIEMLFVRSFMRSYAIPCVATSLLTGDLYQPPEQQTTAATHGPMANYHRLARSVAEKHIDVLDLLPPEVTELSDPCGLYFLLWRYTLIVGSQRAVEKQWRNLRSKSW